MVRNSLKYVSYKDRKAVAGALKRVYHANTAEQGLANLEAFAQAWDSRYPTISRSWKRHWDDLSTFYGYPAEIRRVLYTTNPVESVNRSLRKVCKNRSVFPNDEAVRKLFYLATRNIADKWTRPISNWNAALNRFAILFGERVGGLDSLLTD